MAGVVGDLFESMPKLTGEWLGTGIAGGLLAEAVIGGLASSAYGWEPGYAAAAAISHYGYDEPYRWGGGYTAPVSYGHRYHRVVRPAHAYTADPIRSCGTAGIPTTHCETSPFNRNQGRAAKARPFRGGAHLPLTDLRRKARAVRKPAAVRELFSTSSSVA